MRPYLDAHAPAAWKAAGALSTAVGTARAAAGLTDAEAELVMIRASQLNGCAYCLDVHVPRARAAGVSDQKLDVLAAWRETELFDGREQALLAVAEAATQLPLSEDARADLAGAQQVLGDEAFVAAEWTAATINLFNRVSILSGHRVSPR